MTLNRRLLFVLLVLALAAGCAVVQRVERPEGPFEIVLLGTADTRGELEPCG